MRENIVKNKSEDFALEIIRLFKRLQKENQEYVLSKQILRSGTSIGAMIHESEYAESKADFIHKLSIAQKENNETLYWLKLLFKSEYITREMFNKLYSNAEELIKLLTSIIKSTKRNNIK